MKTIKEIRKNNLLVLINDVAGGNQAQFARTVKIDPTMISNIKNPKLKNRNMGDDLARKVEVALNKATGWMDKEHSLFVSNKNSEIINKKLNFILDYLANPQTNNEKLIDAIYLMVKDRQQIESLKKDKAINEMADEFGELTSQTSITSHVSHRSLK